MSDAYARIRESRKRAAAARKAAESGKGLSVLGALDFQEDIASDRGLLAKARRLRKGEKMDSDSAAALNRKITGTKGGFFGETVDVKGKYTEKGYVRNEVSNSATGSIIGAGVALAGVSATLLALSSM